MQKQPHRGACERTKSKQKQNQVTPHSNRPRVLLFDLAHRQCNDIIKGWLLVNINVWLSMMSGDGANPIFFNKKKNTR